MNSGKCGYDPYFRENPGADVLQVPIYKFDLENNFSDWKLWRTNDGRILPNAMSGFECVNDPFETGSLIMLTSFFDPALAGKAFGGSGMRAAISPPVKLNARTFIELDLYYPKSAIGKYMRLEFWSTSSGGEGSQSAAGVQGTNRTQVYIRTSDIKDIDQPMPDWIGFHNSDTWYKKSICAVTPVSSGTWDFLNIDLHTETGIKLDDDKLLLGNIRITQIDENTAVFPDAVNEKSFSEVPPLREKYNKENGNFLIGTSGNEKIENNSIMRHHFELVFNVNNLKPECHVRPPRWLREEFPKFKFKFDGEGPEWDLPSDYYRTLRDTGNFKFHGHCLSWINQSPPWMRQVLPENVTTMQWNTNGLFYSGGADAVGPYVKVNKNTARRIYFNHVLYEMRHFMSTSERYGSSKERGIIPFHSFDVVNIEIHESRHSTIIKDNPNEWRTALKHVSWLMAMTDNDFGNIRQNYMYLLFKYAHIAVPNAMMAEKYKANYNNSDIVPDYMKADNHDDNGSIDAYICEKPPLLIYNDYEINIWSKMKVACNMFREINSAWKTDPLYDGRNLIECLGIHGHDVLNPTIATQNQAAIQSFIDLIDENLLDYICYSEVDIRQPVGAPGGKALAPAVLNEKQADAIGYQFALFFKMFEKHKKYIDHVTIWSQYGASYMDSYVLFDHEQKASQAYYAVMDPDRYIKGHSYLDEYFTGEYEKILHE